MKATRFPMKHEQVEGVYRRFRECRCGSCGFVAVMNDTSINGLPDEAIKRKFQQKGWSMGQRGDDDCPKCVTKKRELTPQQKRNAFLAIRRKEQEKPMTVAEAPRQPTQSDKSRIRQQLLDYYDDVLNLYQDDFSDRKIGEMLKVPFAWVSNMRDAMGLGPDDNENGSQFHAAIVTAREEMKKLRADAEGNLEAAATLEKRLADIERGGYKRAT